MGKFLYLFYCQPVMRTSSGTANLVQPVTNVLHDVLLYIQCINDLQMLAQSTLRHKGDKGAFLLTGNCNFHKAGQAGKVFGDNVHEIFASNTIHRYIVTATLIKCIYNNHNWPDNFYPVGDQVNEQLFGLCMTAYVQSMVLQCCKHSGFQHWVKMRNLVTETAYQDIQCSSHFIAVEMKGHHESSQRIHMHGNAIGHA